MKSVPFVIEAYSVEEEPSFVRERIREEFVKHRHVTDSNIVDMLVFKGENELIETLNVWKTRSHILLFLDPKLPKKQFVGDRYDNSLRELLQ